ncbi:MAG: hypothetical protein ACXVGB_00225 [Mycobacteriaceae bacterium]
MNRYARDLLSVDSGIDPWGWCMGHWFAIAELLYLEGEDIPEAWEFRAPLIRAGSGAVRTDDYPDDCWAELWLGGYIDADELRKVGNILTRYAHLCVRAGLDY